MSSTQALIPYRALVTPRVGSEPSSLPPSAAARAGGKPAADGPGAFVRGAPTVDKPRNGAATLALPSPRLSVAALEAVPLDIVPGRLDTAVGKVLATIPQRMQEVQRCADEVSAKTEALAQAQGVVAAARQERDALREEAGCATRFCLPMCLGEVNRGKRGRLQEANDRLAAARQGAQKAAADLAAADQAHQAAVVAAGENAAKARILAIVVDHYKGNPTEQLQSIAEKAKTAHEHVGLLGEARIAISAAADDASRSLLRARKSLYLDIKDRVPLNEATAAALEVACDKVDETLEVVKKKVADSVAAFPELARAVRPDAATQAALQGLKNLPEQADRAAQKEAVKAVDVLISRRQGLAGLINGVQGALKELEGVAARRDAALESTRKAKVADYMAQLEPVLRTIYR